jgi:hypothetical protein
MFLNHHVDNKTPEFRTDQALPGVTKLFFVVTIQSDANKEIA